MLAATTAALAVLAGGTYALLFAFGKIRRSRALLAASYAAYGVLAISAVLLSNALRLHGAWLAVIAVMLAGYLLAPAAIWQLCVGTHGPEHAPKLGRNA